MLIHSPFPGIVPMWKRPFIDEFKSTGLNETPVTHDFEIQAWIPTLLVERDADFLKLIHKESFWYARVTDVSFTFQKLTYNEFGATYELRGTVTFKLVDYFTEAKALAPCFTPELRFRDELIVGYMTLGDYATTTRYERPA